MVFSVTWVFGKAGAQSFDQAQPVQRHGGTIHVESMLGLGSTFTMTLPVEE